MAFYEGIDEEIYEGGDHYVPMQQFRLNKFVPTVKTTPVTSPTSTSYGIPTIYPYGGGGGGGTEYLGAGIFGDLDPNKTKTFTKEVWEDADANTPGSGGWVTKEVEGWLDPKSGQYKTWEGKNINHLGIEVPTIAGALLDKSFGKGPQPGDIKGTFTDGWDSGIENIKEGWDEEKDKWSGVLGIDRAKAFFQGKKENQWGNITDIDSQENQPDDPDPGKIITKKTIQDNKPTGDGPGSWGGHGSVEAYDKSQAETYSRARDRHDWADGGRIGFSGGGYLPMGMWGDIGKAYEKYLEENKDSVGPLMSYKQFWNLYIDNLADGGRVGLNLGGLASIL